MRPLHVAVVSGILLLVGLGFYVSEGTSRGNWTDPGVYSFAIVVAGLGATGLFYAWAGRTTP